MAKAKKSPVSELQKKQAQHVRAIAQAVAKKSVPVEKLRLMIQDKKPYHYQLQLM